MGWNRQKSRGIKKNRNIAMARTIGKHAMSHKILFHFSFLVPSSIRCRHFYVAPCANWWTGWREASYDNNDGREKSASDRHRIDEWTIISAREASNETWRNIYVWTRSIEHTAEHTQHAVHTHVLYIYINDVMMRRYNNDIRHIFRTHHIWL